ncbi:MFS transporter [Microbaculum marinisediminis]|uniref:Lysosomal dipeptide transporter MFSD1 n=1 Tax=Microbaculum marinisediminis TaxID=2931392 RepID=A0AAW5QXG0_9HYPH|nr:MFS transporter [Microbaculum sp. A6E488]MCT8971650.1 MFS transporter [Microbaculum sp. A6E488]
MSDDSRAGAAPPPAATIFALISVLCAIYVVSQFLRNSVGVIAPNLSDELGLAPQEIGVLSSTFFLAFAAAQIPLGVAIDRYGPKLCMLASVGIAVVGCLIFAWSDSLFGLTVARALMGLGCSSFFMGPLTIYTRWFHSRQFSTLTGVQLGVGTIGTLFATAPLAWSTGLYGWRATFVFVAVGAAVVGLLVAMIARDAPPGSRPEAHRPASLKESFAGLGEVIRVPGFWPLFAIHFVGYAAFVTVLGLWGGPFVTDVLGYDLNERGNILLVMAAAQIVGLFAWGPTDRLYGYRRLPVSIGALSTAAMLLVLCVFGDRGGVTIYAIFIVLGFVAGFVPVQTGHGRALFDKRLVGRGITFLNLATIGGVFVLQAITGVIIGAFPPVELATGEIGRPFAAYQAAFAFLALCVVVAWVYYRTAPDPKVDTD